MTGEKDSAIRVEHLAKTFHVGFFRKKVEAVRNVSLTCGQGEIFGFLGPNGAGKTTTIKIILGLVRPDAGRIEILGRPAGIPQSRKDLGFLPENPYFHEHLRPKELLEFHGKLLGLPSRDLSSHAERLLDLVQLEKDAYRRPLKKLSKGMMQRVGFAQAMLGDPHLLILDEPMSGLDPIGRKHFREIIVSLNQKGKTIFFSSHILSDVEMLCTSVAIVNQGMVTRHGRLEKLLATESKRHEIQVRGLTPEQIEAMARLAVSTRTEAGSHSFIVEGNPKGFLDSLGSQGEVVGVALYRESLEDLFLRDAFRSLPIDDRRELE